MHQLEYLMHLKQTYTEYSSIWFLALIQDTLIDSPEVISEFYL